MKRLGFVFGVARGSERWWLGARGRLGGTSVWGFWALLITGICSFVCCLAVVDVI